MTVHYALDAAANTLKVALKLTSDAGWAAVGFSTTGALLASDMVAGWAHCVAGAGCVEMYHLASKSGTSQQAYPASELSHASATAADGKVHY